MWPRSRAFAVATSPTAASISAAAAGWRAFSEVVSRMPALATRGITAPACSVIARSSASIGLP
jgi:hypothetical protein